MAFEWLFKNNFDEPDVILNKRMLPFDKPITISFVVVSAVNAFTGFVKDVVDWTEYW